MAFTNNVMIVRHKLLAKLVNLWKENKLTNEIDRLPIELSPRRSRPLGRCCIHKERAVYKYKLFPLLGFDMTDETDELTPLSEYAPASASRLPTGRIAPTCPVLPPVPCAIWIAMSP